MGVDGLASARSAASPRDDRRAAAKRHSLGASSVSSADLVADSPRALAELSRRRTSIPPDFTYGTEDDADARVDAAAAASERRWRSFDVAAVSAIGSSVSSSASAARLATLASRIERERAQLSAAEHAARPSRSRRRALFASFLSPSRKEQIELRRMEMVARVAACNRSLVVLRDTLTTLALAESADDSNEANDDDDVDLNRLADADAVLAEDCVHHVLALQLRFLRESAALHGDKALAPPRGNASLSPSRALQQFLSEFTSAGGVPCALDAPTRALVRFEKLLARHKLLKPALKRSLDALCRDTLASFTRDQPAAPSAAQVWTTRAPQDVLPSLVRELEDSVLEAAPVTASARGVLRVFLEQMVFTRLAGACYRSLAVELDEQSAQWREQVAKARALQLDEVGLPVELPPSATDGATPVLRQSIDAFNALPHLVPSSVLGAFLRAVRVLYGEANALLGLPSGCISADVLLPLLVFVLSRSELPHLHAQVFLMEQFAIDVSQEGSEAAYYLACLQAAMGYIMTEVGKPAAASVSSSSSCCSF